MHKQGHQPQLELETGEVCPDLITGRSSFPSLQRPLGKRGPCCCFFKTLFSPLSIRELNAYLGVLLRPLSEMMYIMRFV